MIHGSFYAVAKSTATYSCTITAAPGVGFALATICNGPLMARTDKLAAADVPDVATARKLARDMVIAHMTDKGEIYERGFDPSEGKADAA